MHQGDYTSSSSSYYQFPHLQNPNPNPNYPSDPLPNPHASAPPFTSDYTPYPQNTDPAPASPTAPPSYPPPSSNHNSNFHPFQSQFPYQPQPQPQPLPHQHQSYYPPYDQQNQTAPNYTPSPPSSLPPNPNSNPLYSSAYSAAYTQPGSYETPFQNAVKFDQGGGYLDDGYGSFNGVRSDYGKQRQDEGYGDGVFAYEGGKVEPYGARGTAPKSSNWAAFDDYGRAISFPSTVKEPSVTSKIVKAVPRVDAVEDVKSGVQKFRVKVLAETGGQSTMDVLCQIGLDGIRMLDPNTSRTLRIYPLENITRCEKFDPSTLAFWSKSSVDAEPRRIRLQSNSYTTNTLLDTVTAATIQFKEMGGSRKPAEHLGTNEQPTEKKKGLGDWMNLIKPANEEKEHWVPDEAVSKCTACGSDFGAFNRRHHCRNCGDIFCDKCTHGRIALTADENAQPVRVCDRCMAEVTQRLSNAKESSSKPVVQSHEDLARKLQEELERNRKTSGIVI
ncbi:putative chromatin regulator PHD family [Lupinus albus]|uniref:Putative chromatin regulator PHD family n=1 Tax=Lupinus albus TaxID=3870 RepID=A0A6A4P1Z8_LUPAL|nr:putative chromatin regulator PHD family [Lupinus albus]